MSRILVTGGTGFLGAHIIVQAIAGGHEVAATLRDIARRDELYAMIRAGGVEPVGLVLIEADLLNDARWAEAVAGRDFVLHVASPFPAGDLDDEMAVIGPALDGTLRVLRAARDGGVGRLVLTSSFAAIGYGHPRRDEPFDETDWSHPEGPDVHAYIKSKIVAERAAWDFIAREGGGMELTVINPTGIFGPVLGPDYSASIGIVKSMLDGRMPFAPLVHFGVVDVRDVARLHLLAMSAPAAAGERFIAVSGGAESDGMESMYSVATLLRRRLGTKAAGVPRVWLPDGLVRLMARFVPSLRGVARQLGFRRRASNAKARRLLGWEPRSAGEAILATAESLIALPPSTPGL